ncbi:MAG TPA: cytochrome c biogenesis protein CcdA [Gemmatimonadaceae bacterium]|nr:cytochrome c biogenesis protein CcdA [Gemmatimonadaceae bacterium]
MTPAAEMGLLVAFLAGLISFLSPCVLPLVPSYLTFITGISLEDVRGSRRFALLHAALFVLGFSMVFVAMGVAASAVGRTLLVHRQWLARAGGAVIIVFGLYLAGAFNIGFLARDTRPHLRSKPLGYLGTVVVGMAFGAGWSPCLGPILGSILTFAATAGDAGRGAVLLSAYSLGLAVPFLVSAVALEELIGFAQRNRARLAWLTRASGVLLVVVGVLLVTGYLTVLTGLLQRLTPAWILNRI